MYCWFALTGNGPTHGVLLGFFFFLGPFIRVLWLLSWILRGESSSELVHRGGVLVPRLAWVGAPAWFWVDVPGVAMSRSSRSSRVEDCLLGGRSGGSLPCMMARIRLYSGLSSSAISNFSGSVGGEVENPWQGSSSSARWTSSSELLIRSGGPRVFILLIRLMALWMSRFVPLSGWFSSPLM